MMKVFLTGGTGFIGKPVLKRLLARGDEVWALARSDSSAAAVEALGAHAIRGDLDDVDVLRAAMTGCDVVFHVAGWYKLGGNDPARMYGTNVRGARNVLKTAFEVGVPRIIHTSSVAVNGDTHGQLVDETFFQGGPFLTDYDRSKWQAHYEVALPLIQQGAPIIIVMPGVVYGPGDHSLVGEFLRWFWRGWLPVLPGPETMLAYTYVDDVAEGLILAADKGKPGESYIIAGPALTMAEWIGLASEISGKQAPLISIPAAQLLPLKPVIGALEKLVPLPMLICRDSVAILGASYIARAHKARIELGWTPRPLHEGMRETLDALAAMQPPAPPAAVRRKRLAAVAIIGALGMIILWRLRRRRKA
ncbi:MAG: NAD-dependent epimerase/dehydratase family protein [Anaerolineae bacterium]